MPKCRTCFKTQPFTSEFFDQLANGRLAATCKACRKKGGGKHLKALAAKYGLTLEQFNKYRARCCALCGSEERISIDHCHKTGRVRDTLCTPCNTGLGMFKDRPDVLRLAAEYVEDHAKRHYWAAKHEEYKAQTVDKSPEPPL